jgi:hypothetical protein
MWLEFTNARYNTHRELVVCYLFSDNSWHQIAGSNPTEGIHIRIILVFGILPTVLYLLTVVSEHITGSIFWGSKWPRRWNRQVVLKRRLTNITLWVKVKVSRYRPEQSLGGSGRLRLRIFMTFGTMKLVRLSLLHTGRLYPMSILVLILDAESTPGHMVPPVATEKILSDTTGNRSRDPLTSSAVP